MKRVLPKEKIYLLLLVSFLFFQNYLFAQPGGYAFRMESNGNFGTVYLLNNNSPANGILSTTIQAASTADEYIIEWDGYANKWTNTSTSKNATLTFNWGGGGFNGPNGILNGNFISGKYYTLQIRGLSYTSRQGIMMETDNTPQSFSSVSQPSVVCAGSDASISVVLTGNKSAQERVFIRYAVNGNFGSSKVVEATGTGSTWSTATATIPAADHLAGTVINYYAYTTTAASINASDHDLITLRFGNNGGSNYAYNIAANVTYYADNDNDGFGGAAIISCSGPPVGSVSNSTDSNDSLLTYVDADGDGFGSITLAASGVTNNLDSNDSLLTYVDADGDGFGSTTLAASGVTNNLDSNDSLLTYVDSDGDGFGSTSIAASGVTNNSDTNDSLLTYVDADGDGFGSTTFAVSGVTNNLDSNDSLLTYLDLDDDGYGSTTLVSNGVTNNIDCNDSLSNTYPGATEICYDGIDNDCDGTVDEGCVPLVSEVQTAQCGQTLAKIDDYVYANLVAGAQGYRFKVTNLATNQVQTIDRFLRVFRITQLPNYAFNTEYQVEVAVRKFNVWQPSYGVPCTIKTPATTTQLTSPVINLSALTDIIYANLVPFATGYRFKITNASNPADTQIINRSLREFRMSLLAGIAYDNMTYNVQVAIRNTDGITYLPYGPICTVTTPVFPSTFLQSSQCDEYAVPNNATILYAEPFTGAQGYRFRFQNLGEGYTQEVDRNLRTVRLSDFTGLTPGATYSVFVALKINGVWGSFTGKSCSIKVPGSATRMDEATVVDKGNFAAVAYPNPFATMFAINVQNASQDAVFIKVYDMIGKLVEDREVTLSGIQNFELGNQYPSGVYNVIVSQVSNTKTLRVIKR